MVDDQGVPLSRTRFTSSGINIGHLLDKLMKIEARPASVYKSLSRPQRNTTDLRPRTTASTRDTAAFEYFDQFGNLERILLRFVADKCMIGDSPIPEYRYKLPFDMTKRAQTAVCKNAALAYIDPLA